MRRGTPCSGQFPNAQIIHLLRPGPFSFREAICKDLDIAVRGSSLDAVKFLLDHAIRTYLEDARAESPEVARQLLSRKAPPLVRITMALAVWRSNMRSRVDGADADKASDFEIACHA